jgi:hypothetical protein
MFTVMVVFNKLVKQVCNNLNLNYINRELWARVVKVIDFPFAPCYCGFESCQELWILSCEEGAQLHVAYGTLVVIIQA